MFQKLKLSKDFDNKNCSPKNYIKSYIKLMFKVNNKKDIAAHEFCYCFCQQPSKIRQKSWQALTDNMLYVLWYLSPGLLQIPTVCIGDQSDWDPKGVIFIMSRWRSWLPQPTISLGFLCHSVLEWIWNKRLPQNKRVHNQQSAWIKILFHTLS